MKCPSRFSGNHIGDANAPQEPLCVAVLLAAEESEELRVRVFPLLFAYFFRGLISSTKDVVFSEGGPFRSQIRRVD